MISSLICTGIGLVVGVLMVARPWRRRPPPPYVRPVDPRPAPNAPRIPVLKNPPPPPPAPRLGWIIPGVLPGDVSKRSRGTK